MSLCLCINPKCQKRQNPDNEVFCLSCGSQLLLQGRYRVIRELGKGGFGQTYEVYEVRFNQSKVLKVLINHDPKAIALFKQEAEVLSQLDHPGIPQVEADAYFEYYPHGSQTAIHCLVMEKIEGEDLEKYMLKRGLLPIDQTLAILWLKDLVNILKEVHEQNFFHRDIKPPNIMLRAKNAQLTLIDFGTVRKVTTTVLNQQGNVTAISSAGFTPWEQATSNAVPQSDFFALGRTFVYLLTGKHPLDPAMYDHQNDQLNWRSHAPQISPILADLLDDMMQRLYKDRPQTVGEILRRIADIEQGLKPPKPQTKTPPTVVHQSQPAPQANNSPHVKLQLFIFKFLGLFINKFQLIRKPNLKTISISIVSGFILLIVTQLLGNLFYGLSPFNQLFIITFLRTQSLLKITLAAHSDNINDVAISPDGQTLVSGSDDGGTIKIWNLSTGKLKSTLTSHSDDVFSLAISPDGQTLVSGSDDDTIKIWNLGTGKLKSTLTGQSIGVNSLAISPDGQTLVSGGYDDIKIWNLATGELKFTLTGHSQSVRSLVISPDGQTLVSGSYDKTIKLWNLATGELKSTLTGHSDWVMSLAISPDGQTLVSGSDDKTIKIWNLGTGELKSTLTGHSNRVSSLAISPDGQTLVSGSWDKTIKIWKLATGELKSTLTGHSDLVLSLAISPDGQTLVSGSYDNTIKIWRLE